MKIIQMMIQRQASVRGKPHSGLPLGPVNGATETGSSFLKHQFLDRAKTC